MTAITEQPNVAQAVFTGMNRAGRRREKAIKRKKSQDEILGQISFDDFLHKKQRQQKVERRVLRATTRRKEREEAKAKGLPVKYSIK